MNPLVDVSGVINAGLIAHAQAASVQKSVQVENSSPELAYESIQNDAINEVKKEDGQIGHLSSIALTELKDEEQEKEKQNMRESGQNTEEEIEEEEINSSNPFLGHIVNLEV